MSTTSEHTGPSDSSGVHHGDTDDRLAGHDSPVGRDSPAGTDRSAGTVNAEAGKSVERSRRSTSARTKGTVLGSGRHHVLVRTSFGGLYVVAAGGSVVAVYHEAHDPTPGSADLGQPLHLPDEGWEDDVSRPAAVTASASVRASAAVTAAAAARAGEASAADTEALRRARQELLEYFGGRRRSFSFPMDTRGTAFQEDVWQSVTRIPFGERRSYRDIADSLGNPKMGRAIGAAVRANPLAIAIPGHRVVSSSGKVVGYSAGTGVKSALLDFERSLHETTGLTAPEARESAQISARDRRVI
jgi:methylated-DNA-[protein]-cysteine S-methyltransferase